MVLKFGIDTRNPAIVVNNARLRKFIGFFENAIQQLHAFERLQLPNYKISNFRENKNGEKQGKTVDFGIFGNGDVKIGYVMREIIGSRGEADDTAACG